MVHNPNNGRYRYAADPTDAIASARALVDEGEGTWVAANCRKRIEVGDLLLFKFGGARLKQEPGIYAAAYVTRRPVTRDDGTWVLRYQPDERLTRRLIRSPIVGRQLARIVQRSFGAGIQAVPSRGCKLVSEILRRHALQKRAGTEQQITHGLLILKEPLDKILAGTKIWEIRGKATTMRGPIALIQSKSGTVVGTCDLVDVVGPLSLAELRRGARRTGFRPSQLPYATTYAWVMRDARGLPKAIPYRHPPGAVIWVRLAPSVLRRLRDAEPNAQMRRSKQRRLES